MTFKFMKHFILFHFELQNKAIDVKKKAVSLETAHNAIPALCICAKII